MTAKRIANQHHATFEGARKIDEDGNEYWFARDLAPLLDYQQWRNFMQVIDKARLACEKSGRAVADHFADVSKMVDIGSGAQRMIWAWV
jgi:DNA-damage-inducible protein D